MIIKVGNALRHMSKQGRQKCIPVAYRTTSHHNMNKHVTKHVKTCAMHVDTNHYYSMHT